MFALVWAILSFAGANVIQIFLASTVLNSLMPNIHEAVLQPVSQMPSVAQPMVQPTAQTPNMTYSNLQASMERAPGYYVMDRLVRPEPRYVYWGPEPPKASDLQGFSATA